MTRVPVFAALQQIVKLLIMYHLARARQVTPEIRTRTVISSLMNQVIELNSKFCLLLFNYITKFKTPLK